MKYLTVAEARALPGLRLVLTAHMPGPWGEAAKAILSVRHVDYIPVAQMADEAPLTGWLDILHLAERLCRQHQFLTKSSPCGQTEQIPRMRVSS